MAAKVFSNDMVAHVWAQQRQAEGRSSNGNFYFHGQTLYSYGSHFPVGIISRDGVAWLNADSYSMSTNRHQNDAAYAVSHRTRFRAPALRSLQYVLEAIDSSGQVQGYARGRAKTDVLRYLADHWRAFPETGSDSAAIRLLFAVGSRRTWAVMRRGLEQAAKREAAKADREERKRTLAAGKALCAKPWRILIADAWILAGEYQQRGLRDLIKTAARAHRAMPAGRQRSVLWARLKALRGILSRADGFADSWGNPSARLKAHVGLAMLRTAALRKPSAYEAPNSIAWRFVADHIQPVLDVAHMPPAMRETATTIGGQADRIASERENELARVARIHAVRQPALGALRAFNANKRFRASGGWMTDALSGPDANQQIRMLREMLDSVRQLNRIGDGDVYHAQHAPAIVARVKALQPTLSNYASEIEAELNPLVEARNAAFEANRRKEEEERARVAAMTSSELVAAWMAGTVSDYAVRYLQYPVLRAVGAQVEGCTVIGGTLETSKGATVPLRHAFRVFQFVAACRARGHTWNPGVKAMGVNRLRVGHFEVDRIDAEGNFTAGCHDIRWQEVAALADALGVADCLASPEEIATELESA